MKNQSGETLTTGPQTSDRAAYRAHRRGFLERYVHLATKRGIEFGAFDLPTVEPGVGQCAVADVRSEIQLAQIFGVPLEQIATVDGIIEPRVETHRQIEHRVDYVILCHVLEHVPDVVEMLDDLARLLVPGGLLFLALPDKRETPDAERNSTTLSRLIERHVEKAKGPSLTELAEFSLAWREDARIDYKTSMRDFYHALRSEQLFGSPDVHCNVWRDEEFAEQIQELIRGGYVRHLEWVAMQRTEAPYNEFYVALRRTADPSEARLTSPTPVRGPSVFYRTCNFCGYGQFKPWKRLHAPFPERIYADSPPDAAIGQALSLQYLTCTRCDLTAINPLPAFDTIDRHRFSAGDTLDRSPAEIEALIEDRQRVTEIMARQHDLAQYRETGRFLDVSCGPGIGAAWLRDEGGWDVRAVEPASEFVAFAADRFGLEVFHGLVQDLPEPAGSFDVVMLDSSLQCHFDPLETLLACHRLLRVGGCLFVQAPNRDGLGAVWNDRDVQWGHWFSLTPEVLDHVSGRIGFRSERLLAIQNPIDPEVLARLPEGFEVPRADLETRLHTPAEIEAFFAAGGRPRADFFGMSFRKQPGSDGRDGPGLRAEHAALQQISHASRRPRFSVAIAPDTDVRWPWDDGARADAAID